MRRTLIFIILTGVMLVAGVASAALPPGGTFTDDNGNVHEPAIEAIAAEGITFGCDPPENTKYCPDDMVTRGQMAAFLDRGIGFPDSSIDFFTDDDTSVFEPDVNDIAEAEVTLGCDDPEGDRYCPGDSVGRAQMASFLVRALDLDPIVPLPADPVTTPPPGDDWLQVLNRYRAWSGLDPVAEDSGQSDGVAAHVRYLELTPDSYSTGICANWHGENPASPYYSLAGARAGVRSNLTYASTDLQAVGSWITAPFHAVGLMEPGLRTAGFALGSIESARLKAGLDVLSGVVDVPDEEVLFPGPGSRIELNRFTGEMPHPTEPCGYSADSTWGLPIYALLTFDPTAVTTTRLTYPDGTTITGDGASSRLCVLTEHNAYSSDPTYAYAMATYENRNMVLLFPDDPLTPGAYSVQIETGGQTGSWSFEIINPS